MKLLLIFVSALVLVAQGKVAPSNEEPLPEVVAVEVGAEHEGESVFAEEAPGVFVFEGEEELQRAYGTEDGAAEHIPASEIGVYVPITSRACTNPACASVCHSLGFKYGMCISISTCWCSN